MFFVLRVCCRLSTDCTFFQTKIHYRFQFSVYAVKIKFINSNCLVFGGEAQQFACLHIFGCCCCYSLSYSHTDSIPLMHGNPNRESEGKKYDKWSEQKVENTYKNQEYCALLYFRLCSMFNVWFKMKMNGKISVGTLFVVFRLDHKSCLDEI